MKCPEVAGGVCPDAEACQSAWPCELVREVQGCRATDAFHDAVSAELVRLTLGLAGPDRPELEAPIE